MNDESASEVTTLRAFAHEHHVPERALARWLAMAPPDARALLVAARAMRLRTGQLVAAIELIGEIAVREGPGIPQRPELQAIVDGSGSAPGRAAAWLARLRELRYPQMYSLRKRLEDAVAALALPHGASVVLPGDLSSDELQIRLSARRPEDLRLQIAALQARLAQLEQVLSLLGGADEI
jgi:hypothetical protein